MGAFLAAAAMFSAGQQPTTGGQSAVIRAMQGQQKDNALAPVSMTLRGPNFALPRMAVVHGRGGNGPVWMGIQKRGNRSNRSRFNFNR